MTTEKSPRGGRRFFEAAEAVAGPAGARVLLDGRPVRAPAGEPLELPTLALAEAVAAEWAAQGAAVNLAEAPLTRLAFTAQDKVGPAREAVVADVVRYADNDLLVYRADRPASFVARQAEAFDPWLAWAAAALDLRLELRRGLVARPQPAQSLDILRRRLSDLSGFELSGIAAAAALLNSAILAFALKAGRLSGAEALDLSRLEERHQEAEWGVDAEAAARAEDLRREARTLETWFSALRDDPSRLQAAR